MVIIGKIKLLSDEDKFFVLPKKLIFDGKIVKFGLSDLD